MVRQSVLLVAGVLALAVGCSPTREQPRTPQPEPAPAGVLASATELDLSALMARTRRAFRATASGTLISSGAHVAARVESDGSIAVSAAATPGEELRVQTVSVSRGDANRGESPRARLEGGRALRDWRLALEEVRADDRGLEQQWRFARPPLGRGELRVELAVSGQEFAEASATGLHFVDRRTGRGTRYGAPTWIDAKGTRTPVGIEHRAGRIVLRVPERTLESSTFPATLDPIIGPDFPVDSPGVVASDFGGEQPAIAFDGTNYLVVWSEQYTDRLLAARLTAQGVLLDPVPLVVAPYGSGPAVAFGGGNFMVASSRTGGSVVTRISPAGVVLDPAGVAIDPGNNALAIAHLPGGFLVSWAGAAGVFAARVSDAAVLLDSTPLYLAPSGTEVSSAATPTQFLVTWQEGFNLRFGRVSPAGALLDPLGGVPFSLGQYPRAAASGAEFQISYSRVGGTYDGGPPVPPEVRALRVSTTGQISAPSTIAGASSSYMDRALSTAFNGTDFVTSWLGSSQVTAARVSPAGVVRDPGGVSLGGYTYYSTGTACSPASCLVVWSHSQGASNIVGGRFSSSGAALDPTRLVVAGGPNSEDHPVVVHDGTTFLVAWSDERGGSYATRLTADGGVIDDPAFALGDFAVEAGASNGPATLFVGKNPQLRVRGAIVSAGAIVHPVTVTTSLTKFSYDRPTMAVAASGSEYLVAWDNNQVVHAARVFGDGGVPGGSFILANGRQPAAAFDGTNYLVAWDTDNPTGNNYPSEVRGTRLTTTGALVDATPTVLHAVSPNLWRNHSPSLQFDGINYLHAWTSGEYTGSLRLQRISPALALLDGEGVRLDAVKGRGAVSFDGKYGVVVSNYRGLARAVDGGALESYVIPGQGYRVASASDRAGHTLIVTVEAYPQTAGRLVGRIFDTNPGAIGTRCALAADCSSGFCVDDVCCNTACTVDGGEDCLACSVDAGATGDGACQTLKAGFVCRPTAGNCDVKDVCTGTADECPPDAVVDAGVLCRAVWDSECGLEEFCTGAAPVCPPDLSKPDGTPCDDGHPCSLDDDCGGGLCWGTVADAGTRCSHGTKCIDDGVCNGYSTYSCDRRPTGCGTPEACELGYCNPADGGCEMEVQYLGEGSPSCSPYLCRAAPTCPTTCYGDWVCAAGHYCSGNLCKPNGTGAAGTECRESIHCVSGNCSLGTCCDSACAGPCDDCNLPGSWGTCALAPVGAAGAPSCSPYLCSGVDAGCSTACAGLGDCANTHYCVAGACVSRSPNGATCTQWYECQSANCVDGVCCNTQCSGGDPDDCVSCSEATGGALSGDCTLIKAGTICRPALAPGADALTSCDRAEACTGTSASCPTDVYLPYGAVCRPTSDVCDYEEICDGVLSSCPANVLVADGAWCPVGICTGGVCLDGGWGGPEDAGTADAGQADAGQDDGGADAGGGGSPPGGCGCASAAGSSSAWLALLMIALVAASKRAPPSPAPAGCRSPRGMEWRSTPHDLPPSAVRKMNGPAWFVPRARG